MNSFNQTNLVSPARQVYAQPMTRWVSLIFDSRFCTSPLDGGIEDIGYDEW